jgi:hypothetical protein
LFSPALARAGARVAVWPQDPDDDVSGVEAAVRGAGFEPISIDRVRDRLRAQGDRATAAEAAALDAIQAALAAARDSYLRQDFAAMATALEQAEAAALPVIAQPRHAAVLWELELQRGLAELRRRDLDAARARFALALALDEGRAPRRELYGPDVARAFTEVADARAQIPPRPTPLRIEPRDARVAIDGLPVIDNAAPRALRPGLHVVAVTAPGYQGQAAIVELRSGAVIQIALAPAAGDAVERLGAAWAAGAADAGTESGRRAIADVVAELGAAAAIVVDVDRARGAAGARVIAVASREASAIEHRPTAAAAAAAALAHLAADGSIRRDGGGIGAAGDGGRGRGGAGAREGGGGRRSSGSVLRSWWFWTAVGGVAVVGVGAGLAIDSTRDRTIRVLPPGP